MTVQSLVQVLLMVTGFLIVSWIGLASLYVRERFTKHEQAIESQDERIQTLELSRVEEQAGREEMLDILRNLRDVG